MAFTAEEKRFLPYLPSTGESPPGINLYLDDLIKIRSFTSLEQRGKLIDALADFAATGEVPNFDDDQICGVAWSFMADKVQRDRESYILKTWQNRKNAVDGKDAPLAAFLYRVCSKNPDFHAELFPEYEPKTTPGAIDPIQRGNGRAWDKLRGEGYNV